VDGVEGLVAQALQDFPFLTPRWALRLVRAYGTEVAAVLGQATRLEDLGTCFGADLYQAEVRWLMEHEYALSAQDVVWRRSKLGLRLSAPQIAALDEWINDQLPVPLRTAAE